MHFAVEGAAGDFGIVFHFVGVAFVQIVLVHAALVAEQTDGLQLVFADVGRPGGIQLQCAPVPELDHGAREILDGVAQALLFRQTRSEFVVCACHHPDRLRISHQPESQIQTVHAEVDQRSASGLRLVIEPRSHRGSGTGIEIVGGKSGDSAAAEPDAPGIVDLSKRPFLDHRLHRAGLRIEAVGEVDAEFFPAPFRGVEHLLRLGGVHRHRLFAEDVGTGLQTGDGQFLVLIVRNGDRENVELLIADHVDTLVIDLSLEGRPLFGQQRPAGLTAVRDGNHLDIRMGKISGQMSAAHSESDHTGSQFFRHVIFLRLQVSLRSSPGSRPCGSRRGH